MHFITRERIHVDRIATAWAIRRFIDAEATFEFVPRTRDVSGLSGIPFDVRGAELGHHRGRCTLEALLDKYEIRDEALTRMARIIRAADLPQEEPTPAVAPGVLAIFDGVRDGSETDQERLERGFVVCDALYAYCRASREAAAE
ncbi:MAG TPA: chromate resistance protein ChrB domain-containing protein [Candidatus Dormibacteraeota bacterium]|nr:chromate resistance protein ChrB domain-containing protein [Candidatus Dormibacteraeota bacterium]